MLIGSILKKYVSISNKMTAAYEKKYSLPCDVYFPRFGENNVNTVDFSETNIFATHAKPNYNETPDLNDIVFIFVNIFKKESMNSPENEFQNFYLGEDSERPFIETSKSRELPIQSKIVVDIEGSKMFFYINKKTVVNGAGGNLLLRQWLEPIV